MNELPQDPKGTAERFVELYREEDKKIVEELNRQSRERNKQKEQEKKEQKKQERQQRRSELIEKVNDKRYNIIDVIINRSYLMILVIIIRLSIFWYFFIWGSRVFLKSVFTRMEVIYSNGIEANGFVGYMFKLFLEFASDVDVLKGLLILILGADLLPTVLYGFLGIKRNGGTTKYNHPMRFFNPLYISALFMRFIAGMKQKKWVRN